MIVTEVRFEKGMRAWIGGTPDPQYLESGTATLTFEGMNRVLQEPTKSRVNWRHVAYTRQHNANTIEEAHKRSCDA